MGHKFRTAKVLRTCSILEAKFLITWTTAYAGKLFLELPERMKLDWCQVFYLPDAAECFQLQIHTAEVGNSVQFLTVLKLFQLPCIFLPVVSHETGHSQLRMSWTMTKTRGGQLVHMQVCTGHTGPSWAPESQTVAFLRKNSEIIDHICCALQHKPQCTSVSISLYLFAGDGAYRLTASQRVTSSLTTQILTET